MKANDRIRSDVSNNQGTVKFVSEPANYVIVRWDGFAWDIKVPASIAREFVVIGTVPVVEPIDADLSPDEAYEGACDSEAARRLGD